MDCKHSKKRIFSGMQPSGDMTLGHLLGAVRNWTKLQDEYDCLYCTVDLHAITMRQDPKDLRERSLSLPAQYIAAGIDTEKSTIFLQSTVPAHAELAWLLNCNTYMGELSRMTQFKAKTIGKSDKNIGVGLFDYPVLMAADILLYDADLVPVGADQKQHLELTRDIATRMNHHYGDGLFVVPEPYIGEIGARVMSLQDPTVKMSKSDANQNNYIALLDEPDLIAKKIKKSVMDSIQGITFDSENRPGVANLLTILATLTNTTPQKVAAEYENQGNAALKNAVTEVVLDAVKPFQAKYHELMEDKSYLNKILSDGSDKAKELSAPIMERVYERMGFYRP